MFAIKQCKMLKGKLKELHLTNEENTQLSDQVTSLRSEVKLIPQLEEDNSLLEDKLDDSAKLLDDRVKT